jgi:hypothetical protein
MSYYDDRKEQLKQKLWVAIDSLGDSEGFVLIASSDVIQFTKLASTGWDEHVLELEPLNEAEVRREVQQLYKIREDLIKEQASYASKISARKHTLKLLDAAVAKATDLSSEPPTPAIASQEEEG